MIFNSNISDEVSLPQILDCFIEEDEQPSTILNFLFSNEDDIEDIIGYSDYSSRLFSLEFLRKCSSYSQRYDLYRLCDIIKDYKVRYFVWQILQSDESENTKKMFRQLLNGNTASHPHSGCIGKEISNVDRLLMNNVDIGNFIDIFNRLKIDAFSFYVKNMENSIFVFRFLQSDVFDNLTADRQYVLIKGISEKTTKYFHRIYSRMSLEERIERELQKFVKGILCSDVKPQIKYEMFYSIFKNGFGFQYPVEIRSFFDEVSSYSEISLKMSIYGVERYASGVIMYILEKSVSDKNFLQMLFDFEEYDSETMEQYFNICEMVRYMKKSISNG